MAAPGTHYRPAMHESAPGYDPAAHRRFAVGALAIFLLVFLALAWRPSYRADWLLENAPPDDKRRETWSQMKQQ